MTIELRKAKVWNGVVPDELLKLSGNELQRLIDEGDPRIFDKEEWGVIVPFRWVKYGNEKRFVFRFIAPFAESEEKSWTMDKDGVTELEMQKCKEYYFFRLTGEKMELEMIEK